ncbi:MAG: hypothetical protein RL653_1632, partial [Pseudomonadota bacterium]
MQPPLPLQKVRPHSEDGSCPPDTGVHVPALPGTSHRSHTPSQAALQQAPSVHCPEAHAAGRPQGEPSGCLGAHVPASLHQAVGLQSPSEAQPSPQLR